MQRLANTAFIVQTHDDIEPGIANKLGGIAEIRGAANHARFPETHIRSAPKDDFIHLPAGSHLMRGFVGERGQGQVQQVGVVNAVWLVPGILLRI